MRQKHGASEPTGEQDHELPFDLTVVGDINADLIMAEPASEPILGKEILVKDAYMTLGGSASLMAATSARLGLRVRIVGKIGDDDLGRQLIKSHQAAGVDTSLVIVDPHLRTGITVSLTWPHDRALITYAGPISALAASEVPAAALANTRHIHVASFFLQKALQPGCAQLFRDAHELGLTTSLDTGDDPANEWDSGLSRVLEETDVFIPNESEAARITGQSNSVRALESLAERVPTVAVKLGAKGAIARFAGRPTGAPVEYIRIGPYRVSPVDTTGAGDAFDAGFLHAYLHDLSAEDCLRWAAASGALATTWLGGQSESASAVAVLELIARQCDLVRVGPL